MGDRFGRVSTRLLVGFVGVVVLLGAAAAEVMVHRPVGAVVIVIFGLGSWAFSTNRQPSRWFYLPSGAAFLAALILAPFNHDERINTIGSVLLAVGIFGGVETVALRFLHKQLRMSESDAVDS
jgi:hypothetical protein